MIAGENRRPIDVSGPGLGELLDDLTTRYRGMVGRFGKIVREKEPPPAKSIDYAVTEARLAAVIDQGTDPAEKQIALLGIEAHRHEQIGRLAVYLADYEAAHGDFNNVPAMRDLGRDHLDLASRLRGTIADEQASQPDAGTGSAIRNPEAALTVPFGPNTDRAELIIIGRALAELYIHHELYEHNARSPGEFQVQILDRAQCLADALKLKLDGVGDIIKGRGEFAAVRDGLMRVFVSDETLAEARRSPSHSNER